MNKIKLGNFEIGGDKLTILAGPCVIESQGIIDDVAKTLKEITAKLGINYVFKASFDKANRSSIDSFRGPGIEKGLSMLKSVKEKYNVPVITDIHTPEQAEIVAEVADILQIRRRMAVLICMLKEEWMTHYHKIRALNTKKGIYSLFIFLFLIIFLGSLVSGQRAAMLAFSGVPAAYCTVMLVRTLLEYRKTKNDE